MSTVQYPSVRVALVGEDGNAYNIIGKVRRALEYQVGADAANTFTFAAYDCDSYDALLRLVQTTVAVV